MSLFTIGHSNHSIEGFIALLHTHRVTALADVRSHPYSRYLPHFNVAPLKEALKQAGIAYVFLGNELGARPKDATCYDETGKALYERIASTAPFQVGLQRVIKGSQEYDVALMCAEQDPLTCHRAILVCQHLRESGLTIQHILKTGELESHNHLEDRLLAVHNLLPPDPSSAQQLSLLDDLLLNDSPEVYGSREEALREAYRQQGNQIAYVEESKATSDEV